MSSRRSSWAAEDSATTFAAGITLDWLEVKSYLVDMLTGMWQKGTAKIEQRFANKQVVLGELLVSAGSQSQSGFAVYCNQAEVPYEDEGSELWRAHMLSSITREGRPLPTMSYVIGPQSLVAQLSLDTDPTESASNDVSRVWWRERKGADTEAKLKIPGIDVVLSHEMARHGYDVLGTIWCGCTMRGSLRYRGSRRSLAAGLDSRVQMRVETARHGGGTRLAALYMSIECTCCTFSWTTSAKR